MLALAKNVDQSGDNDRSSADPEQTTHNAGGKAGQ
jgi:hypothetical protein